LIGAKGCLVTGERVAMTIEDEELCGYLGVVIAIPINPDSN
jgi:hypothetical protein